MSVQKPTSQKDGEVLARKIADKVVDMIPEDTLFCMLIFGGRVDDNTSWTAYIGNANRQDTAMAMMEHIEKVVGT